MELYTIINVLNILAVDQWNLLFFSEELKFDSKGFLSAIEKMMSEYLPTQRIHLGFISHQCFQIGIYYTHAQSLWWPNNKSSFSWLIRDFIGERSLWR